MLANDMGSAALAGFWIESDKIHGGDTVGDGSSWSEEFVHTVSLGGEAGLGSRIMEEENPEATFPPIGYRDS